ncbi:DUF7344 domain-containing protein [Halobacterium zhouii]|uniref:DUF7344 domain-containing protein n=1 Tax=Halobacterium zhouii TaxID=2902624 RepID=UPI001E2C69B6|nr:hypothetical protein [Halobacterium zhouii]
MDLNGKYENESSVAPGVVLSVIANEQQRAVINALDRADDDTLEFDELTERVAERVRDGEPADGRHRRRVRTALHHTHIPKLESCGMVRRDPETDTVQSQTGDLSRELLAVLAAHEARE